MVCLLTQGTVVYDMNDIRYLLVLICVMSGIKMVYKMKYKETWMGVAKVDCK